MSEAVVPGRFQPFHIGHASIIGRVSRSYETVHIGVTSHAERVPMDPLTYGEREDVLSRLYDHPIYAIERPQDPDYIRGQLDRRGEGVIVVTANPETAAFVSDLDRPVDVVPELGRLAFNGERIRQRVRRDRSWRHLVPATVAAGLDEIEFEAIVDGLGEQSDALSS